MDLCQHADSMLLLCFRRRFRPYSVNILNLFNFEWKRRESRFVMGSLKSVSTLPINIYWSEVHCGSAVRFGKALPGFLITAPPSVRVSAVPGALAVWIQNQKKKIAPQEKKKEITQTLKQNKQKLPRRPSSPPSFVCLSVYACDSKSIAGVSLRRDSTDLPIPAHHLYMFLM